MAIENQKRRADAVRNRAKLLDAAESVFSEQGTTASVAEIAKRAGVGKGTLFRHFATKEELLANVVVERLERLIADGEELEASVREGKALFAFVTLAASRQQDDFSVLTMVPGVADRVDDAQRRLFQLMDRLASDAHREETLRADVTGADVALLMCAPGHIAQMAPEGGPDLWRRYLAIILDGLRPAAATPITERESPA